MLYGLNIKLDKTAFANNSMKPLSLFLCLANLAALNANRLDAKEATKTLSLKRLAPLQIHT